MRRLIILTIILVFTAIAGHAQTEYIGRAEVESLRWGGQKNGWNRIFSMDGVVVKPGRNGRLYLQLMDNSPEPDENTDMLIHFDSVGRGRIDLVSSVYEIKQVNLFGSRDVVKLGSGAGGFLHLNNVVKIRPLKNSLLYPGKKLESFTIDFYLFPTLIYDESTVLWMEAPLIEYNGDYTGFKVYFKEGRLFWSFDNMFIGNDGKPRQVEIGELHETPLYEWHHHALNYDSVTGLLTLYRDGKEENIVWVTETGSQGSSLLTGRINPLLAVPLEIGKSFIGYMDEFRISRGKRKFNLGQYKNYGVVKSDVSEFKSKGTGLVKVGWESEEKNGTAVRIMYRISDEYFLPDEPDETAPRWVMAKNGKAILNPPVKGKYLQWKALLYGTENSYTPILYRLEIVVEPDPPPATPILLNVLPLEGGVKIKWVPNKERDIKGYKLYYGTESGTYFGKGSSMGDSPITLGPVESLVLKGLVNEQVYFFSLTAVDAAGQESGFSREFAVRPSRVYGE